MTIHIYLIIDGETGQNQASGKTRDRIDEEVKRLTTAAYERAKVRIRI